MEIGAGNNRSKVRQHHLGHVHWRKQFRGHNGFRSHCQPLLQSNHGVCVCVRACVRACDCVCVCAHLHVCVCTLACVCVHVLSMSLLCMPSCVCTHMAYIRVQCTCGVVSMSLCAGAGGLGCGHEHR